MKRNINSIINARGLARKLIDAEPDNEKKSLQISNLVNMKFDKYLNKNNDVYKNISEMSEEYIAKKALEFVHSSRGIFDETVYRYPEFKGDFSPNSFYDSCERILSGDEKIGNCLGLSSVIKYLLDSKGIESYFAGYLAHLALDVKIDGEFIHLESTSPYGFRDREDREKINNFEITSQIKSNLALSLLELGRTQKAIEVCNESIKINPKNGHAYTNRAVSFLRFEMFEEAVFDSTRAIKLYKNNEHAYDNRSVAWQALGMYENALADLETYASFSEDNARRANEDIINLRKLIGEKDEKE